MYKIAHIDFETRSTCDLKARGVHAYATDPTTDIWCLAFQFDGEAVMLWHPDMPETNALRELALHVEMGGIVKAHNAAFELAIWNEVFAKRYGMPALNPEQVRCTMAQAYAMSLPGSLENAAAAVGLAAQKDMKGHRLMLQMAQPRRIEADGTIVWWEDSDRKQRLFTYCKNDVAVEVELDPRLMPLSEKEQALWVLDQKINNRGVRVDVALIQKTLKSVESEKKRLDAEMRKVAGGAVASCSAVSQLGDWIRWQGVAIDGVAKADVIDALKLDGLPSSVRQALLLRQEAGKTSTAKLGAMLSAVSADGRVRHIHQYHAAATGRWGGRRIQGQNFPRPRKGVKPKHIEEMVKLIDAGRFDELDLLHGPMMDAIADCLRAMIVPALGHDFIICDFSSIEARVLAWLAGEEAVLEIFAGDGKVYEHAAARIFNKAVEDVTDSERQIGKVAVLALGYGGGVGAFQTMAKGYGVVISDSEAEIIKAAWRKAHPAIVQYWYDVENAAIAACLSAGEVFSAGAGARAIKFVKKGSFLWCRLPSGRCLAYPYPRIMQVETPWGAVKDALTYKSELDSQALKKAKVVADPTNAGRWHRISTYGGSLVENVTQAVARDILADSMFALEAKGYPVVMHVHDEVVCEVPEGTGDVKEVMGIMSVAPAWAPGLPMDAKGWRSKRYGKD